MQGYNKLNAAQRASESDPFTEERYRLFYKFMPEDAKYILDIGCNTGRGGKVLKAINHELTISGLDIVKDRLDRLPAGVYTNTIHGSTTSIPVVNDSFDVVVAGEFIEHLYPSDVDKTLYEIFRVLKVGGRVLLTTPNPAYIRLKLTGRSVLGGAHVSQHHADILRMRLKMTGFNNVRTVGCGRVTRYLGCRFPLLSVYGSYLALGDKR